MKSKYLKYLYNKDKNVNIILLIISLIVMPFILLMTPAKQLVKSDSPYYFMVMYMIYVLVLVFALPFKNFYYLHSKRAVDTYGQLPLTKMEVFRVNLIYTILQIIIPSVIGYLLSILILYIKIQMITLFSFQIMLITLFLGIIILIITIFIYQKCNSVIDALIINIMYHVLSLIAVVSLTMYIDSNIYGINFNMALGFLAPIYIYFASLSNFLGNSLQMLDYRLGFIILVIEGVVAAILLHKDISNRQYERAEQLTDSYFCYPFIIVACTALIVISFTYNISTIDLLMVIGLVFVPYIIGIFIYKRVLKIKLKYVVVYAVIISATLVFNSVFVNTNAFGIVDNLPKSKIMRLELYDYNSYETYKISDSKEVLEIYPELNEIYQKKRENDDYGGQYMCKVIYPKTNISFYIYLNDSDYQQLIK